MFGILKNSAESNIPVEMVYMSEKGVISQRVINVYNVNQSHIKALCHTKKQVRIFKIDNILSVLPYKPRKKFVS
jgi:predicted DNA-binding transcriptional regulator YafY